MNFKKRCPICGYPLQFKYKNAYGLRLNICTNEPEICSFISNDLIGGKMSIQKCDKCIDGYMIIKKSRENGIPFLGCTNFTRDGKGCNNSMTKQAYYSANGLKDEPLEKPAPLRRTVPPKSQVQKTETANTTPATGNSMSAALSSRSAVDNGRPTVDNNMLAEAIVSPSTSSNTARPLPLKTFSLNGVDTVDIVGTILQCVIEISEKHFFGTEVLLDVLRGSVSKKVRDYKLTEAHTYGKLAAISRDDLKAFIDWLIKNKFLYRRNGRYPVLHITYSGNHYRAILTDAMLKNLAKTITMKK